MTPRKPRALWLRAVLNKLLDLLFFIFVAPRRPEKRIRLKPAPRAPHVPPAKPRTPPKRGPYDPKCDSKTSNPPNAGLTDAQKWQR